MYTQYGDEWDYVPDEEKAKWIASYGSEQAAHDNYISGLGTSYGAYPAPATSSSSPSGGGPQYIPGATLTNADSAGLPAGTVGGSGVGVGQAPPPMSPAPAPGVGAAPVPYDAAPSGQYGGGGGYTGGSYTGGGSGGSYGSTGTSPMPGGRSDWSAALHASGALQNPAGGVPFDQAPGASSGMFDPYMQARGWSDPATSTGVDPTSSLRGGQPNQALMQEPVMAPPVGVSPPPQPQFGSSPQTAPANPGMQAPSSLGMNMNSPVVNPQMQPPQMAPMTPPPVGGMTPEEAALRAAAMNQDMRARFGTY